jgi:hypothetical protein
MKAAFNITVLAVLLVSGPYFYEPAAMKVPPKPMSLAESLVPYTGPVEKGIDTSSLFKKVMCGYQGWFMAAADGYGMGYIHWGGVAQTPPKCAVDSWPDLSGYDDDEKFATNYKHADGSTAYVFSSTVAKTVHRHFRWMKQYGIDGAFVQRLAGGIVHGLSDVLARVPALLP